MKKLNIRLYFLVLLPATVQLQISNIKKARRSLLCSNGKENLFVDLGKSLGETVVESLRVQHTSRPTKKTIVPRSTTSEALNSKESMKRIADSLREKAKLLALKADAKKEREKKKEENKLKQHELKEKRAHTKEKRAQEKAKKAQEKCVKGKSKKQRSNKKTIPHPKNESLSLKKCCLKCGLAFGDEIESNRNAWRNCEFKLSCPNLYFLKCLTAQSSSSDLVFAECQSVN
jgi:hypothetical protein